MTPKRIIVLLIVMLFAMFVVQNAEVVEVRLLFWKTQASRALVLIGTFVFGVIAGWLTGWLRQRDRHPKSRSKE